MNKNGTIIILFLLYFCRDVYCREILPFGERTLYVSKNSAEVYEEPNVRSKIIHKINFLQFVYLLKITNIVSYNGKSEYWCYVDTQFSSNVGGSLSNLYGWVKANSLVGKADFKSVSKINEIVIKEFDIEGNPILYYHIFSNGIYVLKLLNNSIPISKNKIKGKVYKHKNILLIGDNVGIFYYDEEGKLNSIYSDIQVITNEEKFPEEYHILTGDNVNVHTEAITNSKVLLQLKKGARVKVLERSDIEFTVGDKKGYWVYIDTGVKDKKGKTIKGWIVDIYLKPEE